MIRHPVECAIEFAMQCAATREEGVARALEILAVQIRAGAVTGILLELQGLDLRVELKLRAPPAATSTMVQPPAPIEQWGDERAKA